MTIDSTRHGHDNGTRPTTAPSTGRTSRSGTTNALKALGHRWPTLLALALVLATFGDGLPPRERLAGLLAAMALCYLLFGFLRGELRPPGILALQIAGVVGFGAVTLVALAVDGSLGLYVVAAGWLAHGVWDFAHHRTGRVVPRAWSEWCGVVDVLGAVCIALLT
jgi:hypothetical protein